MCSYYMATSELTIVCDNPKQKDDVRHMMEEYADLIVLFEPSRHPLQFDVLLTDSDVDSSFDEKIEAIAKQLYEKFGLRMSGYLLEEVDGCHYRGELDDNQNLQWVDLDWLSTYTVAQILELRKIAESQWAVL